MQCSSDGFGCYDERADGTLDFDVGCIVLAQVKYANCLVDICIRFAEESVCIVEIPIYDCPERVMLVSFVKDC